MAAAKRQRLSDLPLGRFPRLDKHFAELNEPFVYEHVPGMSRRDAEVAAAVPHGEHRDRMIRLLRELAGVRSTGPLHSLSASDWQAIAEQLVKYFVPAFGKLVLVPTKRPIGRPPTGLTARQKAAIEARAEGETVISVCRRMVRGKNKAKKVEAKKAKALAAAWRRWTTKP